MILLPLSLQQNLSFLELRFPPTRCLLPHAEQNVFAWLGDCGGCKSFVLSLN